MGELQERMRQDLRLRRLSPRTTDAYLGCVRRFARWAGRSPGELGPEHVREFLIHLVEQRRVGPATQAQYLAALRFVYETTLGRPEVTWSIPRPRQHPRMPVVLAREELAAVMAATRHPKHRAGFALGVGVPAAPPRPLDGAAAWSTDARAVRQFVATCRSARPVRGRARGAGCSATVRRVGRRSRSSSPGRCVRAASR